MPEGLLWGPCAHHLPQTQCHPASVYSPLRARLRAGTCPPRSRPAAARRYRPRCYGPERPPTVLSILSPSSAPILWKSNAACSAGSRIIGIARPIFAARQARFLTSYGARAKDVATSSSEYLYMVRSSVSRSKPWGGHEVTPPCQPSRWVPIQGKSELQRRRSGPWTTPLASMTIGGRWRAHQEDHGPYKQGGWESYAFWRAASRR